MFLTNHNEKLKKKLWLHEAWLNLTLVPDEFRIQYIIIQYIHKAFLHVKL